MCITNRLGMPVACTDIPRNYGLAPAPSNIPCNHGWRHAPRTTKTTTHSINRTSICPRLLLSHLLNTEQYFINTFYVHTCHHHHCVKNNCVLRNNNWIFKSKFTLDRKQNTYHLYTLHVTNEITICFIQWRRLLFVTCTYNWSITN